ncbi:hypothetical protein, partial [Salmonella enterica]|uniref:hypothetical protein n=1 Tax=Salmonella enterica TaxID=28901 RepID=UPI0035254B5B
GSLASSMDKNIFLKCKDCLFNMHKTKMSSAAWNQILQLIVVWAFLSFKLWLRMIVTRLPL